MSDVFLLNTSVFIILKVKNKQPNHINRRQITLRLQYNVLMGNSGSWFLFFDP